MSHRAGRGRVPDYDERDYHRGPPRGPVLRGMPGSYDDVEIYERREERRMSPPPMRRAPVREYEEAETLRPAFLRDEARRAEAGPMVLRSREVEEIDRRRPRSASVERTRTRIVQRERETGPAPGPMPAERRMRFVERSPSPSPPPPPAAERVRIDTRVTERRRERSPSPVREHERIRIFQRESERERERDPTPSPSPPPPPPVIRGPTIEREVITHYRDIDHGVERAVPSAPSPPPPARPARKQERERETDIDIFHSHGETDIDIHSRARSRSRPRERPSAMRRRSSFADEDLILQNGRDRVIISAEHGRRRARSAAPMPEYEDEADYITSRIEARGRMGEAWNGATKDWTIVDVPPGTERIRMDGVGGASADVTWQRYNGVRRSRFVPETDGALVPAGREPEPVPVPEPERDRHRLNVSIHDSHRDRSRDRTVVEDVHDTRISIRDRGDQDRRSMWTEITKDLVVRDAIEQLGYEYEETEWFFYVMEYLRYEDVLDLVKISDQIRRARKQRAREMEWEREARDRQDRRDRRDRGHQHHHHHHRRHDRHDHQQHGRRHWDEERERIVEREVFYDRGQPPRGYR